MPKIEDQLRQEIRELCSRLTAAEEALDALRKGSADTPAVPGEMSVLAELRQTGSDLLESKTNLEAVFDATDESIFLISADGTLLALNRMAAQRLRINHEAFIGKKISHLLSPEVLAYRRHFIDRVLTTGEPVSFEDARNGRRMLNSLYPIHDETGKVVRMAIFSRDITDLLEAEENLKKSENLLKLVIGNLPAFVAYVSAPDLVYRFVNDKYANSFGRPKEKIVGQHVSSLLSRSNYEFALPYIDRALNGESCSYENSFPLLEGHQWIQVNYVPEIDESGKVNGIVILNFDLTGHKMHEKALLESEARFRMIVESSSVPMTLNDDQANITFLNPAFIQTFGYTLADLPTLEHWWTAAFPFAEYRKWVVDSWNKKLQQLKHPGKAVTPIEVTLACKNGENKIVQACPCAFDHSNDGLHMVVFQDITARKKAEEALLTMNDNLEALVAERTNELKTINKELTFHLNEIEQFTYIASHDLQEPLRTLSTFTRLVREECGEKLSDGENQYITFISDAASRMSQLVKGLLDYSLLGKDRSKMMVDCNKIVGEVIADMSASITANNARITVPDLPVIFGYETELRLLFQNLLSNAIKFRRENTSLEILISCTGNKNEWQFSVTDNGIGIERKNRKKIFVIFKQLHNRSEYEGIGIGLAHCKKIVELHGGKIWVESTPGAKSTFLFTIPGR